VTTDLTLVLTTSSTAQVGEAGGFLGFSEVVLNAMGEWGVALLVLVETVFPPIPSEIVLPLAGFIGSQGVLNVPLLIIAATLGSWAGALLLYGLARSVGERRTIAALSRLPLVDREDFEGATRWFRRHGRGSVFFGRLIPGVRSLISLPAGSTGMPLVSFSLLTIAGSGIWNSLLILLGFALGSQYEVVERYSEVLDWVVYAAIAGVVAWLVIRRIRRARHGRRDGRADPAGERPVA